ncbi:hypothetical protein EYF80_017726 [Liparis tanakae]|uniref:Uncharacterized protein n=1 Tax=Liparis tanakae TaxID=230148 RepID=A0A4Z2I1X4_9TELE|nr:hypothetical protein EYF80_017726 [Liparis tanakae]
MLLSDICRRAAMGGTLASVAGSRVTSAFMSHSSSSSWFNTATATKHTTALAGLLPASDSLLRCWCDSARHSISVKRALSAMAGWLGSWVGGPSQLLLDDQRLLQQLEGKRSNTQEVAFIRLRFERLVDDGELGVVLDVLPPGVAVTGAGVKDHRGGGVIARATGVKGYITIPASSQKSCRRCQISFIFPEEMAARSSFCHSVCSSAGGSQRDVNTRPDSEKALGRFETRPQGFSGI